LGDFGGEMGINLKGKNKKEKLSVFVVEIQNHIAPVYFCHSRERGNPEFHCCCF
jgi:hypothetical protein